MEKKTKTKTGNLGCPLVAPEEAERGETAGCARGPPRAVDRAGQVEEGPGEPLERPEGGSLGVSRPQRGLEEDHCRTRTSFLASRPGQESPGD